jgi:hypothetical protein
MLHCDGPGSVKIQPFCATLGRVDAATGDVHSVANSLAIDARRQNAFDTGMKKLVAVALISTAVFIGCGASSQGSPDSAPTDPIALTFVMPTNGAEFVADQVGTDGDLVAKIPVQLEIMGAPTKVVLTRGGNIVGSADANGVGTIEVALPGADPLIAIAYNADNAPAASDEVDVVVKAPQVANCRGYLDLYKIPYTVGPAMQGVPDPVTVPTPVGGIEYRYVENTTRRTKITGDCSLVLSLLRAAPVLRARNVVEVADIGIYNYRCIGGGVPPGCTLSQHAQAKAIDIAGVTDRDGVYYNVTTDWIIDPASEKTCDAPTVPGKDAFLHELICALKANRVWNIMLTPNYNADHRNHFHVDLTTNGDTIHKVRWVLPLGND